MDLFSLVARLTLDRSQYEQGIDDAKGEAKSFGEQLKSGLGTAAKVGSVALAAVGTAAVAATSALVKQAGEVAAYGDNIDKASQKLGISAQAYQEWDAVLQHSGTSIDSMGVGMKTLANQAAKGSDAFTALGISTEKAASMSREDLFSETVTALQNVTDENKRAQLAQELFGRSAMELGPLLNTTAEETQAMRDRVHELGGVMSDEAVKNAAAYEDALQDMNTAIDGAKRSLFEALMPAITSVMDAVSDFAPHIKDLISTFQDFLPIIAGVTTAFVTYKTAVAIGSVIDAVTKATEGMSIAQAALNAVMNANPIMLVVSAITALISILVTAYMTNEDFRNKVNAAWKAVKGTIGDVVNAIGGFIDDITGWLGNLGGVFGDLISGAANWGRDLVNNFVGGIQDMWDKAKGTVSRFAGMVKSFLGFSEPEQGPLSNFHTYAPDMVKLFAQGIEDNQGLVADAIGKTFALPAANNAAGSAGREFTVPVGDDRPINVIIEFEGMQRLIYRLNKAEEQRVGVRLAEVM